MQNNIRRKYLAFIILVLFVGTSICPSIASFDKNIEKTDYILNENKMLNLKYDSYNNLIKQAIESGVISNNDWLELDKLTASDGEADDEFGFSVFIDGIYILIGAPYHGALNKGKVYVFRRDGMAWVEDQKLTASDGEEGDLFGFSISIDGEYALIGAKWDDENETNSGSVYVFKRDGSTWSEEVKLTASNGQDHDNFGCSISIDGDYALIGALGYTSGAGSAYVFKQNGTTWTEEAMIFPHTSDALFGETVSIDGEYALIGAPDAIFEDSVYIYKHTGTTWTLEQSWGGGENSYGDTVSLNGDYALIGDPGKSIFGSKKGSISVYKRDGATWKWEVTLRASDVTRHNKFGDSISFDSDYILIGAPSQGIIPKGSGYVFKRDGITWKEEDKLTASDGEKYDYFGSSVSLDDGFALIGAPGDNDNGDNSGSAYVFIRSSEPLHDFTLEGYSPIDLNITDANGCFINETFSNIPGATYTEEDYDGDGELDDRIYIPDAVDGLYIIEVIPEQNAEPTDTYSLKASLKDISYYLATDVMIQDIPPEGYSLGWPDKPSIPDGPISGNIGETYIYTSSTIDPDGADVYYLFDWDDGTDSGWIGIGEASHRWLTQSNYNIRVKAKDSHNFESRWSDPLPVTMPRNKSIQNTMFQLFLEQFPILHWLFQRLIGLQ